MGLKLANLRYGHWNDATLIPDGGGFKPWKKTEPPEEPALHVTYDPSYLDTKRANDAVTAEMERAQKDESRTVYFNHQYFLNVIKRWDLEGEDGNTYPLNLDTMEGLNPQFIVGILDGCREDLRVGEAR